MTATVLVTGGSGYVAGHLVAQLLNRDYNVRTTVRSLANTAKVAPLNQLSQNHEGRLEIFEADLLMPGSFDAAVVGCDVVFHVASPFKLPEKISDGRREMIEPAVQGTNNILAAIEKSPSVKRLVFTSTVGAIFGDYCDVQAMDGGVLADKYWNTTSTVENNPYHLSKTLAEQAAWAAADAQDRWDMVAINPGLILGPALTTSSESGSLFLLDELLKGYFFYGAANFSFTVVDVRDVALAHIEASERPAAHGRYILAEKQMYSFLEMSRIIRPHHARKYLLPQWQIPDVLVRVVGSRFGLTQDYITKHLGIRFTVDNARSINELGINYIPVSKTLIDHYQSWAETHS